MPAPPQVIDLVERFARNLDAYKRAEYKEAHVRVEFIRQIETTDRQIDALVYELYSLTDEEIAIVEGQ